MGPRMQLDDKIDPIFHYFGIGAAGGILMPITLYGDYLTTHGWWLLSYAEWMKLIGSLYILSLLSQTVINILCSLVKFKRKQQLKRKKHNERSQSGRSPNNQ